MFEKLAGRALYGVGLIGIVFSIASRLQASQVVAPEIDGSVLATGLGLLSAGALILRSRRRRK